MSPFVHPGDALFSGEKPFPALAACEHFAGSEKLILKALGLQDELGPVFDITADCEDGAKAGEEEAHARMVARLADSPQNRFGKLGVRIHDPSHSFWRQDVQIVVGAAAPRLAYVTVPKATSAAQVAEVSVGEGGVRVHKVVCAVDCGVPVNPDNVRAQMEGGIGFGLGAIMAEELTLTGGEVDQANYDSYTPLRIDAMPDIEVHIVPSTEPPTGVGEPGVPPVGPAVANAIYAATGKRVRVLPIARAMQA